MTDQSPDSWSTRVAIKAAIFLGFLFAGSILYMFAQSVASGSLWIQVPVLVVMLALIGLEFAFIWADSERRRLFGSLKHVGLATPFLLSGFYLPLSIGFFSSLTFILAGHGLFDLTLAHGSGELVSGKVADFYSWHLLDAIPLLDVNETLRWAVPVTYDSGAVGLLLLTFKMLVILPTIGIFRTYSQYRKEQGTAAN